MISDQAELVALRETVARLTAERDAEALLAEDARQRIAIHDRDRAYAVEQYETAARVAKENTARAAAAEAERDALRKRTQKGEVAWLLHGRLYPLLRDIDIRLRDDAERVRVLVEPEVTP